MPVRYVEMMDYYSRELPPTPWVESVGVPWTPLAKSLADCTVMLLASAGVRRKEEPRADPQVPRAAPRDGAGHRGARPRRGRRPDAVRAALTRLPSVRRTDCAGYRGAGHSHHRAHELP
jgi:hypothetical protein